MSATSYLLRMTFMMAASALCAALLLTFGLPMSDTQAHLGDDGRSQRVMECDRILAKLPSSPDRSWQIRMQAWVKCQSLPDRRVALYQAVRQNSTADLRGAAPLRILACERASSRSGPCPNTPDSLPIAHRGFR